jgi:ribokinase
MPQLRPRWSWRPFLARKPTGPARPVVLVAGSLHLDVMVETPHLPRVDQTVTGTAVRDTFGGKGGNQAVSAARAGARAHMAGAVGQDANAALLRAALDSAGVAQDQVQTHPGASGMSVALSLPDGSYGAVIVSGANLHFRPEAVAFPKRCALLLLQNEIPEAANLFLARRARSAAMRVILNAAPARTTAPDLFGLLDLLVVNRGEAADLLGAAEASLDPLDAAQRLRTLGPAAVIVTLGVDGLVLAGATATTHHPAPTVTVVSTHGAGDAFTGALAAEWARGARLSAAAAFAQAAAALHVSLMPEDRSTVDEERIRLVQSHG